MATQDVVNTFVTGLQALTAPTANAATITSLQSQIATAQTNLASLQQQLATAIGTDGLLAQALLNQTTAMINRRGFSNAGLTVSPTVVGVTPGVASLGPVNS